MCHTRFVTVPHRFAAPAAIAAALLVAWTGSASAASIAFAPCAKRPGIECGTLVVPLDHSNPSGDSLPLHVERRRATRPLRGTLVLLAGGPGQAGTPIATDDPVAESVPGWNYVMLDQRGTGQGALRCSALDARSSTWSNAEVAHCADEVGPRRSFFGTRESVFDLEDLRNAMGVNTMALGGISYGTYVTQAYAQAYPTRVSHIVLDSVIDPRRVHRPRHRTLRLRTTCTHRSVRPAALRRDHYGPRGRHRRARGRKPHTSHSRQPHDRRGDE